MNVSRVLFIPFIQFISSPLTVSVKASSPRTIAWCTLKLKITVNNNLKGIIGVLLAGILFIFTNLSSFFAYLFQNFPSFPPLHISPQIVYVKMSIMIKFSSIFSLRMLLPYTVLFILLLALIS